MFFPFCLLFCSLNRTFASMKRFSGLMFILFFAVNCLAAKGWHVEAEDGGYVKWLGDSVADIHAPGGLTLWNNQKLQGNVVIEYDARIVSDGRVSDLNCFWMASGGAKSGKFVDYYAQKMYYMGYGGNYNKTTRFRRYNGDQRGITQPEYRPAILREYTDEAHLIKPDHWYHIRLEQIDGRVRYIIDGECLVDFIDMHPLTEGYFGFRTTLAHAQLKGLKIQTSEPAMCREITLPEAYKKPQTFGIPFLQGEMGAKESVRCSQPSEQWNLAYWPDGSVKWKAMTIVPEVQGERLNVKGERLNFWLEQDGKVLPIRKITEEFKGKIRKETKYEGDNFILRRYIYKGSNEEKFVVTHFIDSTTNSNGMQSLALRFKVPVSGKLHERKVAFLTDSTNTEVMSVKPLFGRRPIFLDEDGNPKDSLSSFVLNHIAAWDGFRLSQLSPNAFSIRKRATEVSPWIGTIEGRRAPGVVALGNKERSYAFHLDDFWQSYPSTLQVDNARSDTATVSLYLWSPEAEKMNFAHYDTIAHTLEASYEDVQPGMSTAYGIARTSVVYLYTYNEGIDTLGNHLAEVAEHPQYVMPREYLHSKRAFGIWSLDDRSPIDSVLYDIADYYAKEQERNSWYGYFNYGDVMHAGRPAEDGSVRWLYDVGGYAWDNTELGTPAMLWYEFLRTGCPKVWRMAVAMTRHNAEVDCYHMGPHKGLGTRHNVLHWGCGAKEARISEAFWNRFLYYLTADERMGDVMHEVVDADQLLYTLDPMRLAQPRSAKTPCTAPARLRIGPDWLAYASNWFTEWERTQNTKYRDKIERGMESICNMPHGIFSGPKALGYDPATGIITWEGDSAMQNTNHLLPLMGGFEMMVEMMLSMPFSNKDESKTVAEKWQQTWLKMCCEYKEKALQISNNKFRIPRLQAYAYWFTGKEKYRDIIKKDLRIMMPVRATNDAATFTLDAVFSKEVLGK